jgi:hypothetical protein
MKIMHKYFNKIIIFIIIKLFKEIQQLKFQFFYIKFNLIFIKILISLKKKRL